MDTTDMRWAEPACRVRTMVGLAFQIGFALMIIFVWALCMGLL